MQQTAPGSCRIERSTKHDCCKTSIVDRPTVRGIVFPPLVGKENDPLVNKQSDKTAVLPQLFSRN